MTRYALRAAVAVLLTAATLLATRVPWTAAAPRPPSTMVSGGAPAHGWSAQSSGTRVPLFAVSCFDARRCKAVGAGGTLLYTKNGGVTWRVQANPLTSSSTVLYRLACIGRSTCYVIGRPDVVLVTHTGGTTWSTRRIALSGVGSELTDSACVDAQAYDLRGRLALCRLGLLDIACITTRICYVVATLRVPGQFGDLAPAVFLTTDGGSTWKEQRIPPTAPCWGDCGPAGVRVGYPLTWISCAPGLLCRAGGSTFLGSHPGWASLSIKVGKPGEPWTPIDPHFTYGYGTAPDSAVCTTMTTCYGVWTTSHFSPGNAIYRSIDGGATWAQISGGTPKLRNAIACPAPATCYSVGNQGTITRSVNAGPFVQERSGTSHDLYGISCVDAKRCVSVGNKGTIVALGSP